MRKLFLVIISLLFFQLNAQKQSVLDVNNNEDFSTFSVLTPELLSNYNLFFTGEDHRYRLSNSDLELKMFKYLHKTAGVRVFMVEFGQSFGFLMNRFIRHNDSIARKTIENHTYKEYFQLFQILKEFNDSLPEADKFSIVGVDIEREPMFAAKMMEYLLPANEVNVDDSIKIHVEAVKALGEYYDYMKQGTWGWFSSSQDNDPYSKDRLEAMRTLYLMLDNYEKHKDKYREYLGENYTLFDSAVTSIIDYRRWDYLGYTAQGYLFRETYMEENIGALFTDNPGIKVYGQFGRCHTQLKREKEECNYYYFNSLATRLNGSRHPQLNGKVFSCPIFYPHMADFADDKQDINKGLKALIKDADKGKFTLYVLDTADKETEALSNRFNALVINNMTTDKSSNFKAEIFPEEKVKKEHYEWDEKFLPSVEAGFAGYSFTNLNNALQTNFPDLPQFVGFSIGYDENYGINFRNSYYWFTEVEQRTSDSTSVFLKGFRTMVKWGKDILKSNKYDCAVLLGFGYERWKLESVENFTEVNRKDIFGANRSTVYTNPAFITDLSVDFRAHIEWVSIGVFAGYQLDLSNKHWRNNDNINSATPKLSFSSYTVGASLGFNLSIY